jgi:hypothetical protein
MRTEALIDEQTKLVYQTEEKYKWVFQK